MRVHDCVNVFGACDGDWSDVDSLCDDCRIERESALIDAAMDAGERDTPKPEEAV